MNKYFINEALKEAKRALYIDEVPVGAIIVKEGKIISRAYNLREQTQDATSHAEILAIKQACEHLGTWRLTNCSMYVTLEPCPMCAGAILQSRIKNLYIGTFDPRTGACGSVINIVQNQSFNHLVNVNWLYDEESSLLLKNFFANKRV